MKYGFRYGRLVAGICLTFLSGMVYAGGVTDAALPTAASVYTKDALLLRSQQPYLLAANDADKVMERVNAAPVTSAAEFDEPWFSGNKSHLYLGLGTVVLAGLTAATAPGEGCESNCPPTAPPRETSGTTHTRLARATAVMAAATLASGLLYHWDDVRLENGLTDPDNLHAMLGTAGALLMIAAINKSMKSSTETSHAGQAELGAAVMVVAIKMSW